MNRKKAWIRAAALAGLLTLALPALVLADESTEGKGGDLLKNFAIAIGAGLGMSLAAFGGAMGQAKTAKAALDGIARNPGAADKMFVPMIIALALIESLVLYTFIIAIFLQAKI